MTAFERRVRAAVIHGLRDAGSAPATAEIATRLGAPEADVVAALHALADAHRLALVPGTDRVWMAHPFSNVETDCVVRIGERRWFANCAWDGLAILALLGDGTFDTRSHGTNAPLHFTVTDRRVAGEGIIHLLVPARDFWKDVGFT
jgi:hypothetical protein